MEYSGTDAKSHSASAADRTERLLGLKKPTHEGHFRECFLLGIRPYRVILTWRHHTNFARWSTVAVVLALAIWGLTDVRRRARVDPNHPSVHKTDFTVYTVAGAAMLDGRDPYQVSNPRGWKYVYPPLFALVVAPLSVFDPQIQVLVWFVVSVCMCWGCYRECVRIALIILPGQPSQGVFGPVPTWIGSAAVTAAIFPVLNCLQRGQVGVALLYFLLLGYRLLAESCTARGAFVAGGVFALPIVLKATPLLPVAFVVAQQGVAAWYSPWPRLEFTRFAASLGGVLVGLALFLFFVPAALIGWGTNLHHLDTWWDTIATHEENALVENFAQNNNTDSNQSLTNAVHHFEYWVAGILHHRPVANRKIRRTMGVDTVRMKLLLLIIRGALVCLLLVVGYPVSRAQDRLGQTVTFSLAYLLTLIVCQIARGHYFMIWLPVVMFTGVWLLRENRPRWAVFYAVLPGILVVAHYAFLHTAGAVGLLGLGTTLWFTTTCLFILWLCPLRKSSRYTYLYTTTLEAHSGCAIAEINYSERAA